MMTLSEVMTFLESKGSEQSRKVLRRHGARDPFFGVKVSDLKVLQKKIKQDHKLALELFASGNSDAMYLAPMIADPNQYTKEQLTRWAHQAYWYMISDYAVAWAAAESNFGVQLANEWIKSDKEFVQSAGWSAYASVFSITPNDELNLKEIRSLLNYVSNNIHEQMNRVRYAMNGFVIAAGSFIPELTEECKLLGAKIGKVKVNMGNTSCKVPLIKPYIENVESKGRLGNKKKRAVC